MRKILAILISALIIIFTSDNKLAAQGCVAIRGNASTCMLSHPGHSNKAGWQLSTSARYFKSFRHFSGTEENKDRLVQGIEVINHSATLDLALTRIFNDRWSATVDVPIISNARSSLYEHGLVNGKKKGILCILLAWET